MSPPLQDVGCQNTVSAIPGPLSVLGQKGKEKLDPVGSTVRFEVMKLGTGSV